MLDKCYIYMAALFFLVLFFLGQEQATQHTLVLVELI